RAQPQAFLGERLDMIDDDRRAPRAHGGEEIAVGDEADALLPRVVARVEMRGDVEARSVLVREPARDERPGARRVPPAEAVEPHAEEDVLPARDRVCDAAGSRRRSQFATRSSPGIETM